MERITVTEAAKMLGVSPQYVRNGVITGRLPIGEAVKYKEWVFFIQRELVEEYILKMHRVENKADEFIETARTWAEYLRDPLNQKHFKDWARRYAHGKVKG